MVGTADVPGRIYWLCSGNVVSPKNEEGVTPIQMFEAFRDELTAPADITHTTEQIITALNAVIAAVYDDAAGVEVDNDQETS